MKVTKYEIDMIDVGAAEAILIHFYDENEKDYVVSIDAGNYKDGETVAKFVREHYDKWKIDLAICTHCDADHFGGYVWLLENMQRKPETSVDIKHFWINDPGNHVKVDDFKYYRNQGNLIEEARSVFTLPGSTKNLLSLIDGMKNVSRSESFSNAGENLFFDKIIEVLGPTKEYYKTLVPDFRNALQPYDDDSEYDDPVCESDGICLSKALDAAPDDKSAHNQSSTIVLFKPSDGKKFLFTGDMGEDAFNHMKKCDLDSCKNIFFLKVPHHGSKHNLTSPMIRHFNPQIAYISTEGYGRYLSAATKNALKTHRILAYSTHNNNSMRWQVNLASRLGYGSLKAL